MKKKKIQLEKEKAQLEALREEAIMLKEELEANKTSLEVISNTKVEEIINKEPSSNEIKIDDEKKDGFLKFINVAKIKGVLYKKYLDKITAINPNIILCRDDKNKIEIYYGPFNNNETRIELLDKLINSNFGEAYSLEFTKEEFDKRCNY